jgi:hypothetical protein
MIYRLIPSYFSGSFLAALFFLVFAHNSLSAQEEKPLLDYFPEMPASISNAQLRAMADEPSEEIPHAYYPTIQVFGTEYSAKAIGKIETKKAIILLYAEIHQPRTNGTEALLSIHYVLVDKKNSIFMEGTTGRYLAMSGDDAIPHVSNIRFSDDTLIVESIESKIDSNVNLKAIKDIHKVGKKTLEHISRE